MENDTFYSFTLEKPLSYVATGKFEAPSQEWMHLDRWLGEDFELIVVTSGILYMGDDSGKYEVSAGEYLLFPPGSHQFGWRPSACSFYWLHFIGSQAGMQLKGDPEELPEASSRIILIPKFAKLPNADRLVILMKQMQDSIRRYNSPIQNDYLATSVLCLMHAKECLWFFSFSLCVVDDNLICHIKQPPLFCFAGCTAGRISFFVFFMFVCSPLC